MNRQFFAPANKRRIPGSFVGTGALLVLGILLFTALAGVFGAIRPASTSAASSSTLTFQARLLNIDGSLVDDGTYNAEFKIYDSLAGGASAQGVCSLDSSTDDCWWAETRTGGDKVTVKNGYLYANLGSVTAFSSTIPWDQELWITLNIGGTGTPAWDGEMSPRFKVTAVPHALSAAKLQVTDSAITNKLVFATPSASNKTITLPNETGTVCTTGSICSGYASTAGYATISLNNIASTNLSAALNVTSGNLALQTTTSGNVTLTPAVGTGLVNVLTGNLQVGNGTPGVTLNGEDLYVEGTLEVDGAQQFDGALVATSTANFNGNLTLGDATGDTITFTGRVNSTINPSADDTYDLGSTSLRWKDLYLGGDTIYLGTSSTDQATFGYNTTTNILNIGTDSTTNGDIAFFTDDLYLDKSSGYVGIGDTSPAALLSVGSGDLFQVASGGNLTIASTSGTGINISNTGITTDISLQNGETIDNNTNGTLQVTADITALSGDLTVTGGNLGIGTAANSSYIMQAYYDSNTYAQFLNDDNGDFYISGANADLYVVDDSNSSYSTRIHHNGTSGYIDTGGTTGDLYLRPGSAFVYVNGTLVTTSNVQASQLLYSSSSTQTGTICRSAAFLGYYWIGNCSSLSKYKDEQQDLPYGLDTIRQLRPVQYRWNIDGNYLDTGFIAEEVEAVAPVFAEYDGGKLSGVKYDHMISLAIKGIQQLDVQVQDTDARLSVLESGEFAGDLHVSGDAVFGGNLTVAGDTTLANLVVTGITEVADLTVNGKIISAGDTPLSELGGALTAVLGASIDSNGTDTAGTVIIESGEGMVAGEIANIEFTSVYGSAPKIVISGNNAKSSKLGAYIIKTGAGFKVISDEPLEPNMQYSFDYIVVQTTN